ncbi:UNVERIFIED_CONTAM: hypothetical protein FKN15_060885 [Acipenser sinensis]
MAAAVREEETQLEEMEASEAVGEEKEMESEDEGEMGPDGSDAEGDESSDDEKENQAEIQRLEEQLSINAFDYNCHVDLIKLLRQAGELVKLRRARQKMSELFPLTEEIWLDWLKDEIRMAEEESDREKVYELFEKAAKDYICPEIWLEYAQYSIGGIGSQGGIEKVREIFDRALTAVGLHMTKGAAIWEAYREFENAILGTLQPAPGSVPIPEQQEVLNAQLNRIHTLFRRQLAIPFLDMEVTYAEYGEWSDKPIPDSVTQLYKKALQQMEKSKPYEEALLVAEPPKLAEYQTYIDYELKEGDPARIQTIFERAVAENCLVPDMWAKLTQYLDRQLKIKDLVLSCHDRAVRNCPWTVGLWKSYLLALERHGAEHKTVSDIFEKALNAGFIQATDYVHIWQAYLDYLRRRVDFSKESSKELEELRSAFARALDYMKQDVEERFSESGDPSCMIMQNWARVEESLDSLGPLKWLHCTKILEEKAEQRRKKKAQKKKAGRAGEKRKAGEEEDDEDEWGDESEQPAKKHRGEGDETMETESGMFSRKAPFQKTSQVPAAQKARAAARQVQQVPHDSSKDHLSVFVSNLPFSLQDPEQKLRDVFQSCGLIEQVRPVYNPQGTFRGYCYVQFESQVFVQEALKLDRKEIDGRPMFVSPCIDKNKNPDFKVFKYSTSLERHKIFISGLPFSCTKEQLEGMFKEHGTVKDIRLVTNRSGKPKGLAYVEFENEAQASHAVLKVDGTVFQNHTLNVAISNPPRRNLSDKPESSKAMGSMMPPQVFGA